MIGCDQLLPATPMIVTVTSTNEKKGFFSSTSACIVGCRSLANSAAPATMNQPAWTSAQRGSQQFRVYLFSDRGGIYALGYPLIGWAGHLIKLGELVFLSAVLYTLLLRGATLFNALTARTPYRPKRASCS